jgi:hypothetical protein
VEVIGVQLHVANLPVAVQIGGSARHEAPPLRHIDLIFLVEDACHGHHQFDIIVGLGVQLVFKEMCVELVVEVGNGENVVIIRAAIHRGARVGK